MFLPRWYAPVWEPVYEPGAGGPKAHNQESCYKGDDYGGHNIPFPIPTPPKPDRYYSDAFYDMSKHIGQLVFDTDPVALRQKAKETASAAPQADSRAVSAPRQISPLDRQARSRRVSNFLQFIEDRW